MVLFSVIIFLKTQLKNILLTGVAGFIGSKIAECLIQQGHSITGIDNFRTGCIENVPEGVNFVNGDCVDPAFFRKKLKL